MLETARKNITKRQAILGLVFLVIVGGLVLYNKKDTSPTAFPGKLFHAQ